MWKRFCSADKGNINYCFPFFHLLENRKYSTVRCCIIYKVLMGDLEENKARIKKWSGGFLRKNKENSRTLAVRKHGKYLGVICCVNIKVLKSTNFESGNVKGDSVRRIMQTLIVVKHFFHICTNTKCFSCMNMRGIL